jgi:hypothetical protein
MTYPKWNIWANLQFATTTAMVMAHDAHYNKDAKQRAAEIKYAQRQVDYALGSTGRSYVVGWGASPPVNWHHAPSSCPDAPALCNFQNFFMKPNNPQILYGALVGGPPGVGRNKTNPDHYLDLRPDYAVNEPAVDYESGFVGALAGVYTLLSRS